jgi:hypothetical protein
MTDQELLTDEDLDETSVDGEEPEDEEESDDVPDSDNASYAAPKAKKSDDADILDDFSIASRQKIRDELDAQIAEFLARGGQINEVDPNVTADPPKKPTSDYGGRPI